MKNLTKYITEKYLIDNNYNNSNDELIMVITNWIKNLNKPVYSHKSNKYYNLTYWVWTRSANTKLQESLKKLLDSQSIDEESDLPKTGAAICTYVKSVNELLLWNNKYALHFYDFEEDHAWWSRIDLHPVEDIQSILHETLKTGTYMERFHKAHYIDFTPNIDEIVDMLDSLKN